MTLSELDLRNEIKGVSVLKKTLDNHRDFISKTVSYELTFPEFITELSSEKTLVSERLTGKSFRELLDTRTLPYPVLIDFFFQHVFCMLLDGYFHEDIHSGNIFYQDNKIKNRENSIRNNTSIKVFVAVEKIKSSYCSKRRHSKTDPRHYVECLKNTK
jgi:predicted unusual protein kinase regulating ubiquinone biosynthesis (AarF/ABC1/UbiB family)